jgi:hypothetical protein
MKIITILDANKNRCLANYRNMAMLNFSTEKAANSNAEKIGQKIGQPVTVINNPIKGSDNFYLTVADYIG